jgi:hypothetical protein
MGSMFQSARGQAQSKTLRDVGSVIGVEGQFLGDGWSGLSGHNAIGCVGPRALPPAKVGGGFRPLPCANENGCQAHHKNPPTEASGRVVDCLRAKEDERHCAEEFGEMIQLDGAGL